MGEISTLPSAIACSISCAPLTSSSTWPTAGCKSDRVLKDDGVFLLSASIQLDGVRRLGRTRATRHPAALMAMLTGLRFTVDKSAAFGMNAAAGPDG